MTNMRQTLNTNKGKPKKNKHIYNIYIGSKNMKVGKILENLPIKHDLFHRYSGSVTQNKTYL